MIYDFVGWMRKSKKSLKQLHYVVAIITFAAGKSYTTSSC